MPPIQEALLGINDAKQASVDADTPHFFPTIAVMQARGGCVGNHLSQSGQEAFGLLQPQLNVVAGSHASQERGRATCDA